MGQWPGVIPVEGTLAGDDFDRAGETFADPRRDGTLVPRTGADTAALIEGAVESLVILRCPMGLGDAGAVVSCLVSLIAEAQSRLPDAVADAWDQDRS